MMVGISGIHGDNFNRLKNDLIPPADMALSALLQDLEERGLLDETIVAWVGEFGRRPQISQQNAGREHWPFCYNGILAGGPVRSGIVYGASDKNAAYPTDNPMSPQTLRRRSCMPWDLIDGMLLDRENRPHRVATGKVHRGLLS
ncbi:MAG: DUF1501 domain-containing protein [Pirellulaceae bacterium]